jgi:hypothetical protein
MIWLVQGLDKMMETPKQYRNKSVVFRYSFVCLCCVVPVSMRYRLCLVAVLMNVLQNVRLARFSDRTDCCCVFSWNICNQSGHFIKCIQSSSFPSYDGVHKSLDDFINYEEQWLKTKTKWKGSLYIEEDCSTAAEKVTAELNIHLENLFTFVSIIFPFSVGPSVTKQAMTLGYKQEQNTA